MNRKLFQKPLFQLFRKKIAMRYVSLKITVKSMKTILDISPLNNNIIRDNVVFLYFLRKLFLFCGAQKYLPDIYINMLEQNCVVHQTLPRLPLAYCTS